jgi:transposase
MFKADTTKARQLFVSSPRDLLPDDCDVWLYVDLFDAVNLEDFYMDYSSQGEEAIDPRLMMRTVFYGLTHGVTSGRKLASACRFDNRYLVLSGNRLPAFRTFHRFLRRHEERMEAFFVETVRLASKMGLVDLGKLAIDGTRIRAHTSQSHTVKAGKINETVRRIRKDLAELRRKTDEENAKEVDSTPTIPTEIRSKERRLERIKLAKRALEEEAKAGKIKPTTQKSLNDPDAMAMGGTKAPFVIGYNGQAVVDSKAQIVVAADIFRSTTDPITLPPMLDQVKNNCDRKPAAILADSGYQSVANIRAVEELGAAPFFSLKHQHGTKSRSTAGPRTRYEDVRAGKKDGVFYCLAGRRLPGRFQTSTELTNIMMPADFCVGCQRAKSCLLFERCSKATTFLPRKDQQSLVKIYQRSRTKEYKETYNRRGVIVEPVFGNLKTNKCHRLHVTGHRKARTWWKTICAAHNIEKIIGSLAKKS